MKILRTGFGWIETERARFDFDILIYSDGRVENRYRYRITDSHTVGLKELQRLLANTSAKVVIGTGQSGMVTLSPEAEKFLAQQKIPCHLAPTPEAILIYNQMDDPKVGIFHVTC
ncbi:MAG: MTH938/NDUFAF3 family protein [candidate division WOR-3 bacterium]